MDHGSQEFGRTVTQDTIRPKRGNDRTLSRKDIDYSVNRDKVDERSRVL